MGICDVCPGRCESVHNLGICINRSLSSKLNPRELAKHSMGICDVCSSRCEAISSLASDLKRAGFTASEFKGSGVTASELCTPLGRKMLKLLQRRGNSIRVEMGATRSLRIEARSRQHSVGMCNVCCGWALHPAEHCQHVIGICDGQPARGIAVHGSGEGSRAAQGTSPCRTSSTQHGHLFAALAKEAEQRGGDPKPQELANTAWAFAHRFR